MLGPSRSGDLIEDHLLPGGTAIAVTRRVVEEARAEDDAGPEDELGSEDEPRGADEGDV
jgi:hypothetical protein